HPRSRAVADGGAAGRRPARPGAPGSSAAGRGLGRWRPVARRLPVPAPPPGPTRPAAGGGAVHRRPARGGDGAAGRAAGHRRADGPHRRTARPAARPSAAERAARRPTRHPSPRDRQAPARVPSLEADLTMTAPTPPARRLAVLGAGSWGTTFARVLADG